LLCFFIFGSWTKVAASRGQLKIDRQKINESRKPACRAQAGRS